MAVLSSSKKCPKKVVQELFFLNVNSVINFRRVTHFRLCLLETQVQRPRRRGPAARARDAARREAWLLQRSQKKASDTTPVEPPTESTDRNETVTDKDVMHSPFKCAHCNF